jgi:glucose/arabinose dehydrogenase
LAFLCVATSCRASKPSPSADETSSGSTTSTTGGPSDELGEETAVGTSTETGTTGGPVGPLRLRFEEIEVPSEFSLVTDIRFLPGSSELLVLSKDGRVGHYEVKDGRAERLGGFTVPGVHSDLDCGLISLAFDPAFEHNRFVFMSACASQPDNVIVRLELDTSNYAGIPDGVVEIFRASEPDAPRPWHNIGAIGFDETGALWALLGDKRVASNGQDVTNDLSALVRIVPDRSRGGSGHVPAPDNPFVGDPERSPNVYAWGLRSPWRGLYDSKGRWWFGDVGTDGFEEIDIVTGPGLNFGWALHEGPCGEACGDTVEPVGGYSHDADTPYIGEDEDARATIRRAIWLGLEYDPGGGPDPYGGRLTGAVLYGDFCVGFVRALEVDETGTVTRDDHLGHLPFAAGWDRGPDGHIYVASFGRCESVNIDESDPPPSRLFVAVPAD